MPVRILLRLTTRCASDPLGVALLGVMFLISAAGCRSVQSGDAAADDGWDVRKALGWQSDEPPPPEIPNRLVATWTHTVQHRPGQTPVRGFGGRIVFFGAKDQEPVRVDGQLVVYAFDEQDRESYETRPTKRFIYPAEQFVRHESQSKIGPSYSVWIPWDKVGGDQKNISLITRFEPRGGPLILGEQTRHLLPGVPQQLVRSGVPSEPADERSILLTGHQQSSDAKKSPSASSANPNVQPMRRATTILMPNSLKNRIAQSKPLSASVTAREARERRRAALPTPSAAPTSPRQQSPATTDQPPADQPQPDTADSHSRLTNRTAVSDSERTTTMSRRPVSQRSADFGLPTPPAQ